MRSAPTARFPRPGRRPRSHCPLLTLARECATQLSGATRVVGGAVFAEPPGMPSVSTVVASARAVDSAPLPEASTA
jgi:hypothetical protein